MRKAVIWFIKGMAAAAVLILCRPWTSVAVTVPSNSFTLEFTSNGKLNITASLVVDEEKISNILFRLGYGDTRAATGERMFEDALRSTFESEIAAWRKYEGYPYHQADLADIESYKVDGYSEGGWFHLKYRLELRSRQFMRWIDPSFAWKEGQGEVVTSLMMHFPFPDIPIGKGVSLFELAPEAMQYIVILPYPIANSPSELSDITGFLSATAYSVTFLVHPDEYIPVVLVGDLSPEPLPQAKDRIEIEVRDDRSVTMHVEAHFDKASLRRICEEKRNTSLVDALEGIRSGYGDVADAFLPSGMKYDCAIDAKETVAELIFTIDIELPDIAAANIYEGHFEYSKVGDLTFIRLPIYNPFDPANLPFCAGHGMRPAACNLTVIMPGRINNVNAIRSSGLLFKAEGNRIDFYVGAKGYSMLTISSDSGMG